MGLLDVGVPHLGLTTLLGVALSSLRDLRWREHDSLYHTWAGMKYAASGGVVNATLCERPWTTPVVSAVDAGPEAGVPYARMR